MEALWKNYKETIIGKHWELMCIVLHVNCFSNLCNVVCEPIRQIYECLTSGKYTFCYVV